MSTEIMTQESNLPVVSSPADMGISQSDLVIPRILLMQNTSEYVGDDKAKLGDMVDSSTAEVLGGIGEPLEIIPLKAYKTLMTYNMSSGSPKFMRQETLTPELAKLPWEGTEDGQPVKRVQCLNFFVLLASDCEMGEPFPRVISFRSTSMNAGKQLATHLFRLGMFKKPAYAKVVSLKTKKEKYETNTYSTFEFGGVVRDNPYMTESQMCLGMLSVEKVAEDLPVETAKPAAKPEVVSAEGYEKF